MGGGGEGKWEQQTRPCPVPAPRKGWPNIAWGLCFAFGCDPHSSLPDKPQALFEVLSPFLNALKHTG